MPTTGTDPITISKTTAVRLLIGNVLIWFFWATGDRFGAHGHPHLSDAFCFLFYVSLSAETAAITDGFTRRRRLTVAVFVLLCIASAVLAFASSPWSTFASDVRAALPVAASIATAFLWYRTARLVARRSTQDRIAIASLDSQLIDTNKATERLRNELEAAKQISAEANRTAAALLRENLKLQNRLSARSISDEQKWAISGKIKIHGPQNVDIIVVGDSMEITQFSQAVTDAMAGAGWKIRAWNAGPGMSCTGVVIVVKEGSEPAIGFIAMELGQALQIAGIEHGSGPKFGDELPCMLTGPPWSKTTMAPIRMYIGEKPL